MCYHIFFSDKQNPPAVVDRLTGVVAATDGSVQGHHRGNGTIYFLCGFFLVRFDIASRVGADEDVVHHPA